MPTDNNLVRRTRELLRNRPRPQVYTVIAEETGLSVRFLQEFAGDRQERYSADSVQTLYEYLSGKKLVLA